MEPLPGWRVNVRATSPAAAILAQASMGHVTQQTVRYRGDQADTAELPAAPASLSHWRIVFYIFASAYSTAPVLGQRVRLRPLGGDLISCGLDFLARHGHPLQVPGPRIGSGSRVAFSSGVMGVTRPRGHGPPDSFDRAINGRERHRTRRAFRSTSISSTLQRIVDCLSCCDRYLELRQNEFRGNGRCRSLGDAPFRDGKICPAYCRRGRWTVPKTQGNEKTNAKPSKSSFQSRLFEPQRRPTRGVWCLAGRCRCAAAGCRGSGDRP